MRTPQFSLLAILWLCAISCFANTDEDTLFYSTESSYDRQNWESRLLGGFDFSNPYLNLYSAGLGQYWSIDRTFAIGAEASTFFSTERESTKALSRELGPFGYEIQALAPEWTAVFVARTTPLSGMVNFFSSRAIPLDLSVLLRGGWQKYRGLRPGALVGTGLEVQLCLTPHLGLHAALLWDGDKPQNRPWQSRVGFRLGPSVRF